MSAPAAFASSGSTVVPTPLLRVHDETFDPTNPAAYNIYVTAGPTRLRLAAIDVERRKFVALEDYQSPISQLPAFAAQHEYLSRRGWNEVRLAVANRAFTLLPGPLFRPGDEADILSLHYPLSSTETARHYAHANLELVTVFAVNTSIASWLSATHGAAGRLVHHTSALMSSLVQQHDAIGPRRVYLSLGTQQLTLLVLGQRLEYCNVFAFSSAEDVLYYTILVMQELGLNPDQDELLVWGELTHDSAVFALLRTYVRQVRFGSRPGNVQYSYRLNEVFEHRYFDLLSLHYL